MPCADHASRGIHKKKRPAPSTGQDGDAGRNLGIALWSIPPRLPLGKDATVVATHNEGCKVSFGGSKPSMMAGSPLMRTNIVAAFENCQA